MEIDDQSSQQVQQNDNQQTNISLTVPTLETPAYDDEPYHPTIEYIHRINSSHQPILTPQLVPGIIRTPSIIKKYDMDPIDMEFNFNDYYCHYNNLLHIPKRGALSPVDKINTWGDKYHHFLIDTAMFTCEVEELIYNYNSDRNARTLFISEYPRSDEFKLLGIAYRNYYHTEPVAYQKSIAITYQQMSKYSGLDKGEYLRRRKADLMAKSPGIPMKDRSLETVFDECTFTTSLPLSQKESARIADRITNHGTIIVLFWNPNHRVNEKWFFVPETDGVSGSNNHSIKLFRFIGSMQIPTGIINEPFNQLAEKSDEITHMIYPIVSGFRIFILYGNRDGTRNEYNSMYCFVYDVKMGENGYLKHEFYCCLDVIKNNQYIFDITAFESTIDQQKLLLLCCNSQLKTFGENNPITIFTYDIPYKHNKSIPVTPNSTKIIKSFSIPDKVNYVRAYRYRWTRANDKFFLFWGVNGSDLINSIIYYIDASCLRCGVFIDLSKLGLTSRWTTYSIKLIQNYFNYDMSWNIVGMVTSKTRQRLIMLSGITKAHHSQCQHYLHPIVLKAAEKMKDTEIGDVLSDLSRVTIALKTIELYWEPLL